MSRARVFPACWLLLALLSRSVTCQLLGAKYTNCLQSASQAPPEQRINISRVYAQLDNGQTGSSDSLPDNTNSQSILRLVAFGDTGVQAEGFSNVTNYLATLIVETSLLSFVPFSNQSSLCSSIITAGDNLLSDNVNISASSYPEPGGCPYGPGPVLIGYDIPLGSVGLDDYFPLSTLSTRLRILDTSVPPLQLACVDVYTTPYYLDTEAATKTDASSIIYRLILWLPVATLLGYLVVNVAARIYAAWSMVKLEREAAMAASLHTKLSKQNLPEHLRDILLETAIGRSIVRSRSLTRFVTPGVGDVLGIYQWIAMVGMCSVVWQGYAYPIFSRLGWSMLIFDTTIITPKADHTDPSYSADSYPPGYFRFNAPDLFTDTNSPFYFSQLQQHSNLLNIPSTGQYNTTPATAAVLYPTEGEVQGLASFAPMLGFTPQAVFANSLTFFAILLAGTFLLTFLVPVLVLSPRALFGAKASPYKTTSVRDRHSHSSFGGEEGDVTANQLARIRLHSLTSGSPRKSSNNGPDTRLSIHTGDRSMSQMSQKYLPEDASPTVGRRNEQNGSPSRHTPGINRWWAGDKDRQASSQPDNEDAESQNPQFGAYQTTAFWAALCTGCVIRLVMFFHLPITIFSVYQLAHAVGVAKAVEVAFAAIVFVTFSLAVPVYSILRIRRTLTRYLQDDTNTILAYGPLYNTFAQDSYTFSAIRFMANLVEGCAVGGGQGNATAQVAVILVVEIIETLVTSVWLPWGDGAAQGPLQFVLSVSRIITAVLLIVISPAVRLGFTARGWIGYVIILVQAMVVVMTVFILLAKVVELLFRLFAKVEFDESRSRSAGGLFGAFRKKGVLGFRRQPTQRRKRRGAGPAVPQRNGATEIGDASMRHSQHVDESEGAFSAMQRERSSLSAATHRHMPGLPGRFLAEDDADDEYIMSAFAPRPAQRVFNNRQQDTGYVPPGSYSAPTGHQASTSGFQVVRGGRTTDESPYSMANAAYREHLPPGAAARPSPTSHISSQGMPSPTSLSSSVPERPGVHRARAASQSAVVEYFAQDGETSPVAGPSERQSAYFAFGSDKENRRLSAPLPTSPPPSNQVSPRRPTSMGGATAPTWQREPSGGSGFFASLFRSNTAKADNEDEWTESDDSDDENQKPKRRWPFTRNKARQSDAAMAEEDISQEALEEEQGDWDNSVEDDDEAPSKGFVVMRPPPRKPPAGSPSQPAAESA